MKRKVIKIDEAKCNGCGQCVSACQEGAIGLVDGKAKLLRDDYCDGLGNCLPACPTDAISFEEREAAPFDEEAAARNMAMKKMPPTGGCPGMQVRQIKHQSPAPVPGKTAGNGIPSELMQWPIQIKLAAPNAPYFQNANLLIAADCTAFAYGNFHQDFIKGKITLIGCPKLDEVDYADKLTDILANNDIKSITVARMSVPCCGGIVKAVTDAMHRSGKMIPWNIVTVDMHGTILE